MKALAAQMRIELLLTLRRGESVLVAVIIPAAVLMFFSSTHIINASGSMDPVRFYVPASITLAIIASSMVSLGIATGFERFYGVLKRLGGTPLSRSKLLVSKSAATLAIECGQIALLLALAALALKWRGTIDLPRLVVSLVLGTVTFAGLGMWMAGRLRAETNLALSNVLFLLFLLIGGLAVPSERLPEALGMIARFTPANSLLSWVNWSLYGQELVPTHAVALIVWGVLAVMGAVMTFSWE